MDFGACGGKVLSCLPKSMHPILMTIISTKQTSVGIYIYIEVEAGVW